MVRNAGVIRPRLLSASHPLQPAARILLLGALGLAGLAGLLCARAAGGRTGSWSFPIDDAYIYANYARQAAAGHWLQYNTGEASGGITGAGWFLLLAVVYPLTAPFGEWLRGLAPAVVQTGDPALAAMAGRLYASAYALGGLLLALAAWGTARLAAHCYGPLLGRGMALTGVAGLVGVALLVDRGAIWGAYSGLEVPLSLALGVWALVALLGDVGSVGQPRLRSSLVLAALLPWARPELAVLAAAGVGWLAWGAVRGGGSVRPHHVAQYAGATGAGVAALVAFYQVGTGLPLPSSFYAKVGGLRLGSRALAAFQESLAAGSAFPFLLGAALIGLLAFLLAAYQRKRSAPRPSLSAIGLVALASGAFVTAMTLTLPWFGQEDRYVLPVHPLLIVLAGSVLAVRVAGVRAWLAQHPAVRRTYLTAGLGVLLALGLLAHVVELRVWAAGTYALDVQNIEDAHVIPARWLAAHAPPGVPLAAEPIGAIRLFSGHPTVDTVGLTTPALLGTGGDWEQIAPLLRAHHAAYLLYYPRLWPNGVPPAWAAEVARFPVPHNRIAGSDPIAVYQVVGP